jgi:hypothetical protein
VPAGAPRSSDAIAGGGSYRMRASRSASSSHWLAARRTFSFAGRPFGNSAPSSASRLTALRELRRGALELRCVAVRVRAAVCTRAVVRVRRARALLDTGFAAAAWRRAGAAGVARVRGVPLVARLRCERAALTAPTTPCAWRRCAPNAAARVNVRPHSGHLNSPLRLLVFPFVAIARSLPFSCRDACSIRVSEVVWRLSAAREDNRQQLTRRVGHSAD